MYMFLATCIFIYPPLHHPQPPQCEVSIHTNIYTLISFQIFFCKIAPLSSQHKRMWPVHTIPTSSFFGAHGGHFLFEEFPGLGGAKLRVVLGQGAASQWQGGALHCHSLVTYRLGNKKMDVKKNKNSMYITIKKNKQSCCRLPDAKKKKGSKK